ncbi:Abortive infection protein-like C-terminal domain-containing protein [uncultured Gammaproteobacteria bacterium]
MDQIAEQSAYSRRTVVAAIQLMERLSQAELTRCVLTWGGIFLDKIGDDRISVTRRLNNLIKLIDNDQKCKVDGGDFLRDRIVDQVVACYSKQIPGAALSHDEEIFRRLLEYDGFRITDRDGTLRRILPCDARSPNTEDVITSRLSKHGFATAQGHLKQAMDAHSRGDWASANSQIRSFFESLLDEIAIKLYPSSSSLPSSENRKSLLAKNKFLLESLNEWGGDGKNYINGLWKRLHPAGSHPGLSDEDDSTFRIQVVLPTADLLLKRLDAIIGT